MNEIARKKLEKVKKAEKAVKYFSSVQINILRTLRGWPEYPYSLTDKIKLFVEIQK